MQVKLQMVKIIEYIHMNPNRIKEQRAKRSAEKKAEQKKADKKEKQENDSI